MTISKAKFEDYEEIHQIFKEVHNIHLLGTINTFKDIDPLTKDEYQEFLKNGDIFLIAKNDENQIVGFVRAIIEEHEGRLTRLKKTIHIDSLGVLKKKHNNGIGTALIEEIKKIARKEKCDNIILDVYSFNDNAIKFYKHQGFKTKKRLMEINL